jgi:hypothetical protein
MVWRRVRWGKMLAWGGFGAVLVLLALALLAALDNRHLPRHSGVVDRLGELEKARVAEALHLHQALGDSIWPGWAGEDLPVVLYNERFAFLIGLPDPPAGWIKVPGHRVRGGPWEQVPGDSFAGVPYYRQVLPSSHVTPEAFTVRIGGHWAASAPTLEWFRIGLANRIRENLPSVLAAVFPFRLVLRLFIGGTDGYICMIEHEAFHAYQGRQAGEKLAAAERATAAESEYPAGQPALDQAWRAEFGLLARCVRATSREQTRALARQFLRHRQDRRAHARLPAALEDCERKREWLEGLGNYVELESWRRASRTPGYQPLAALESDRGFKRYADFGRRWSQEVAQMAWAKGDGRFYYSGFAQAVILDRLMPGWKSRALADGVWLEDLVTEAVRSPGRN